MVQLHAPAAASAPALLLRPWRTQDGAALVEAYRDPDMRHWTGSGPESEAQAAQWVRNQEQGWAAGDRFGLAVLEEQVGAPEGGLVGHVVLKGVESGKPSAEVGYWTAAHARGRGVAPRALEALTLWAFDTFGADGLRRVELVHQEDNTASCRVAEKSGYAFEKLLPAWPPAYPRDGHVHVRRRR
ncbi:GNAT family N-acetyltransferase [Streptomyces sp. VRA16 Mangrove soil]|nr:GNAT family N-acetyltransferase [Streptomyces sp. VRA16 Mangrove soil]MBO1329962.1 GNAT family N-acetyltransferase [Streptomyces sp. VRA16 Mangrove soil]